MSGTRVHYVDLSGVAVVSSSGCERRALSRLQSESISCQRSTIEVSIQFYLFILRCRSALFWLLDCLYPRVWMRERQIDGVIQWPSIVFN